MKPGLKVILSCPYSNFSLMPLTHLVIILHAEAAKERVSGCVSCGRGLARWRLAADSTPVRTTTTAKNKEPRAPPCPCPSLRPSVRLAGWLAASNSVPLIFREKMDVRLERR